MNRADKVKEIARQEALAAAWKTSAARLREELDREARADYAANGSGVTWTFRDLGQVTLPLSKEAVAVTGVDALLKWCKQTHPEQVEQVAQVRAAYQTYLLKNATVTEDGAVVLLDERGQPGEAIPGMTVRSGGIPGALTITVDREVKPLLANYAANEVQRLLAAEYGATGPEAATR
jgi:hypothetical protein